MLTKECLTQISKIFIGDELNLYKNKSGVEIVGFFNNYFDFDDSYELLKSKSGFPSRWRYTLNSLKKLKEQKKLSDFFDRILSIQYISRNTTSATLTRVEAINKRNEILKQINIELNVESYKLIELNEHYSLTLINNDLECLGSGGFAKVYKSKSSGLAIKILNKENLKDEAIKSRFKREFSIMKNLQNIEGILQVYDFNENEYSYTMECAEMTLDEYLSQNDLNQNEKLDIINNILSIVNDVHAQNVIHRDLSHDNILIVDDIIKISDFGLGKNLEAINSHKTKYTQNFGQYGYCAPEQRVSLVEANKRSDVYSLGSLINRIMTGSIYKSDHVLRIISEKARSEKAENRYEDCCILFNEFKKKRQYNYNKSNATVALDKIKKNKYDPDVANYLDQLDGKDLCYLISKEMSAIKAVIIFIEDNPGRSISMLESIRDNYLDYCPNWYNYDHFGKLFFNILSKNNSYQIQYIAANILNHIAWDINQFSAQNSIKELEKEGIEPALLDILKNN